MERMNATLNQNSKIIEELENAIDQKIVLLQCLDVIYTKAMEFLDKQEYELFLEKIEDQQIIAESVDKIESDLKEIISRASAGSEIASIINGSLKESDCSPEHRKLAIKVETSNKILSGCITLNEKLTYRANNEKANILANMTSAKNRRLIKLNYKSNSTSKVNVNLLIDC
jgi:hypothetical protein